ncbi:hypothetical protein L345_15679, partial [Ophiophagus hannah]
MKRRRGRRGRGRRGEGAERKDHLSGEIVGWLPLSVRRSVEMTASITGIGSEGRSCGVASLIDGNCCHVSPAEETQIKLPTPFGDPVTQRNSH